ncbi:MAG TPA: nucleotidyltransferase domain-containing protein [Pirellulales bacterium]|nr:nucleotidyltransferase domain-containing protein [Pirellulales bacterium]
MKQKTAVRSRMLMARLLDDIVRRVVSAARPEKIVLFGSAARGEMGPNSDVDLLVVKGGKFNRRRLTAKIYNELYGAGAAVDIVIVTPEEVRRYRDAPCFPIYPALREGRVVYGARCYHPAKSG